MNSDGEAVVVGELGSKKTTMAEWTGLDSDNNNDSDEKDILLLPPLPMLILMINKICIYYKFQSIYVKCRVINWDQKKEKINTMCTNCLAHTIQTPVINIAMAISFTFSIRFGIRCDGISSNQRQQRGRWPTCSGMCQARRQSDWIVFYLGRAGEHTDGVWLLADGRSFAMCVARQSVIVE